MTITAKQTSKSTSRETKGLRDSLGGGLETTTPRSARAARKLKTSNQSSISDFSSIDPISISVERPSLTPKRSDSSLSDLSDSIDQLSSITITTPPQILLSPQESQTTTSSRSLPSTPNRSMKPNPKQQQKPSLRKTIIKRSHSSSFGLLRHHQRVNPRLNRNRRLTETQKKEIEQTRIKLLENLQQEEELIRSSQHPILLSLEENVDIAKELRLNQAKQKFEQLQTCIDRLHYERQQRIWDTWTDTKIRLQTEMIVDCQIRLNRAPFEFLISNDTTNLQAIFHLTPTPTPAYLETILSINRPDVKEPPAGSSSITGGIRPSTGKGKGVEIGAEPTGGERHQRATEGSGVQRSSSRKTGKNRKEPLAQEGCSIGNHEEARKKSSTDHQDQASVKESLDLIQGLHRHKINNHAVWQLSRPDILDDLKHIHRRRLLNPPSSSSSPLNHHRHHHPYSHPTSLSLHPPKP